MPLTLIFTEGVLPEGSEKQAVKNITDAMLKWHGLTGNKVMTPNVTATVHIVAKSQSYSGGEEISAAWVEWKTPSFAFNTEEIQKGFFKEATDIVYQMADRKVSRDNIYVNVVHTVDGAWNLDGQAMSNEELGDAIAKG